MQKYSEDTIDTQDHHEIDPKSLQQLAKQAFMDADADKSGLIDKDELFVIMEKILKHLGIDQGPTKQEISEIMFHYDVTNNGELTYDDFSAFIHDIFQAQKDPDTVENCKIIQRILAANISPREMKKKQLEMMVNQSENLNLEFDKMMEEVNRAKELGQKSQEKPRRKMSEWDIRNDMELKKKSQTLAQYRQRLNSDAQYIGSCQVKKTGGITTVITSMGPAN